MTNTDFDYDRLDPGIRDTVKALRDAGFNTVDSGDGVSKPADQRVFNCRHVACQVSPDNDGSAHTYADLLRQADIMAVVLGSQWNVEATYSPRLKSALILAFDGPCE